MKYTIEQFNEIKKSNMDRWFDEWHETGEKPAWDYEELNDRLYEEWLKSMEVGDHCHINRYSDIEPCTVIKKTTTTLTVRLDKATKTEDYNPEWIVGGFAGHCTNNTVTEQRKWWNIEEDPEGSVETFRWSEKHGGYRNGCGEWLKPEWIKFYDMNF